LKSWTPRNFSRLLICWVEALLRTIETFSQLALSLNGITLEIESNPLLVSPNGALAVDRLSTLVTVSVE